MAPAGPDPPKSDRGESNIIMFPLHRARGVEEPFVTKKYVAEYLKVSERWIELRMKHDGFPYHKDVASRLVRYRMSEVKGWFKNRREQNGGA